MFLHFILFSCYFRPAHNLLLVNPILIKLLQILCVVDFHHLTKFPKKFYYSNKFYRPKSEIVFWSVNYHCDITTTWKFVNTFHLRLTLLGWKFIELAFTVHDLLHFFCFSRFWTVGKSIIYRPTNNFWTIHLILMKLLQVIYFNDFYISAKFQKILLVQTDFTDQNWKMSSGL